MSTSNFFNCRKIDKYDGQYIFNSGKIVYELGNYLGGGASGSVYQASEPAGDHQETQERQVAIKILNPLGYKNTVVGHINRCPIAVKGLPLTYDQIQGKSPMKTENVWWLLHSTTKQLFACYEDPHRLQLREIPLPRCIEMWGMNPLGIEDYYQNFSQLPDDSFFEKLNTTGPGISTIIIDGLHIIIPKISPKFLNFLRSRQTVCREMNNMLQIGAHPNIIALHEVMELVQDTKTTLFLVLELINGGELFERMKSGLGSYNNIGKSCFSLIYIILHIFTIIICIFKYLVSIHYNYYYIVHIYYITTTRILCILTI